MGTNMADMPQMVAMAVGCPGSGKSTYGRALDPTRWLTISLDGVRSLLWGGSKKRYWGGLDDDPLRRVILHRTYEQILRAALRSGRNIYLDNTHLRPESFARDLEIIRAHGFEPEVLVFNTPLDVLKEREAARDAEEAVGAEWFDKAYADFSDKDAWWRLVPHILMSDLTPQTEDVTVAVRPAAKSRKASPKQKD